MNLGYRKSKTSILIPMRSINEGKTRLSNLLSPNKREKLIKLLFTQLLKKLKTLKDLGVTQFNIYLDSGDEERIIAEYGENVIPAFS